MFGTRTRFQAALYVDVHVLMYVNFDTLLATV